MSCDLFASHIAKNHQDNSEPDEEIWVGANLGTYGHGNHIRNVAIPSWEHSRCSLKLCPEDEACELSQEVLRASQIWWVWFAFRKTKKNLIKLNSRVRDDTVQSLRKLTSLQRPSASRTSEHMHVQFVSSIERSPQREIEMFAIPCCGDASNLAP